jgi:plastocyanin
MAKQTINIGSVPNDGTGSTLREGGDLINDNFNEIYTAIGDGTTLTSGTFLTTLNTETVQNKTISGSNNTLSNIGNSSLTNSTISIGGITLNLGDTDATPALDLSDATNYPTSSLTGFITNAQLAGSIENAKLLNSTVSIVADDSSAQSISLGGSILFTGGSGITTAISGNEITFSTDGSVVTESSSDVLTNKTINGPDNTLTNIANGSLANSSITLGSDTLNLGDTSTTITGLSLDGTGTIDLTGSGSKARFNFAGFGLLPTAATYEGMFAYDTTGQVPYVADAGGWTRLQTENDSISVHSDVNITGIADERILVWSSAQARFNSIPQKINASAEIDVTNSGSVAYLFNSHYSGNNPDIYVRAGATYAFNLAVSGHPFHLQTVSGAYSSGNAYTTGLTHIATDGTVTTGASALLKETGTLYYEIPSGTSTTIYYACQYHSGMAGSIVVQDDTASASVSFTTDKSNTGDGSTTTFTVTSGRTVDDVLVFVNGICLVPTDDYTISSTTLTFTTAPAASAEIVFRYLG